MNGNIFPDLVKAFFTNLSYNNGAISSYVRGNSKVLGKIHDIHSKGLKFRMNKTTTLTNYLKRIFIMELVGKLNIKCSKNVKRNLLVSFRIYSLGLLEISILIIGYCIISLLTSLCQGSLTIPQSLIPKCKFYFQSRMVFRLTGLT